MSNFPESELVAAFLNFCQENDFFTDFEAANLESSWTDKALKILLGSSEKAAAFEVIGQTDDGSYLAFWQAPGTDTTTRPVCWLGSDGILGVLAGSFAEFLTLVPYGTEAFNTVLYYCEREHASPDNVPLDVGALTQRFMPAFVANMEDYSNLSDYAEWLSRTTNLSLATQPIAQIVAAYVHYPNIQDWRTS